jgi:hypothetical protein
MADRFAPVHKGIAMDAGQKALVMQRFVPTRTARVSITMNALRNVKSRNVSAAYMAG